MSILFQAGTITGLLQGVYDGDINFRQLAQHGDIGLGTFNGVDGEMIALDGVFYHMNKTGLAEKVNSEKLAPFSLVSFYKPTLTFSIEKVNNCEELNQLIMARLPTKNIFYMIRTEASIDQVKLRSEGCQTLPYKPLVEALSTTGYAFELSQLKGTLVTTWCPNYSAGITIPGFHHHFINQDKTHGGHLFDVKLHDAQVTVTSNSLFVDMSKMLHLWRPLMVGLLENQV